MSASASAGAASSLLAQLRSQVLLDKNKVEFNADQPGAATVMVKNTMTGPVQLALAVAPRPGLTMASDKVRLGAGESATITITWRPVGPHMVPAPALCRVSVKPTGAVLPFTVTFR